MNNKEQVRLEHFTEDPVSVTIDGEEQLKNADFAEAELRVIAHLLGPRRKPWWRRQLAPVLRWCERHRHVDDYDVTWFSFPRYGNYAINLGLGADHDTARYLRDCTHHAWRSTVCAFKGHAWETSGDYDWCGRCRRTRGGSC